jgi:hypothetical protein
MNNKQVEFIDAVTKKYNKIKMNKIEETKKLFADLKVDYFLTSNYDLLKRHPLIFSVRSVNNYIENRI